VESPVDFSNTPSDYSWPEPIKYLDFSDRGVNVQVKGGLEDAFVEGIGERETRLVEIMVKKPVKGFVFAEREGLTFSDNAFDIMPYEKKVVRMRGYDKNKPLTWTWIGKG